MEMGEAQLQNKKDKEEIDKDKEKTGERPENKKSLT